jgi:ubiquinone/menaquinone biosynthesis C-methylase UbiE
VEQLHLLPEEVLVKTGPVDHADWNFRPILGSIQRSRFRLMLDLLAEHRFERLLEVGYGSGVFMPELARRCRNLHGIDVHRHTESVRDSLRKLDLRASLMSASAESMPFEDGFFDGVVAVSSFEFIPDPDRACREIRRVLGKNGAFFVVTPGHSQLVDLGLRLLTGQNASADYGTKRQAVMPTLRRHFRVERIRALPSVSTSFFCLYRGMKLTKS